MLVLEGDNVVLYFRRNLQQMLKLKVSGTIDTCFGKLEHREIIGKEYGDRISLNKGVFYVLKTDISSRVFNCRRVTQILFEKDIGLMVYFLSVKAGDNLIECGTGTGILTSVLSSIVGTNGRVFTYESNPTRYEIFKNNLSTFPYKNIESILGNMEEQEFSQKNVDAVLLDMPRPLSAIKNSLKALRQGGRICIFLPCFNQVEKSSTLLRKHFQNVRMFENIQREYSLSNIKYTKIPDVLIKDQQYSHTGYLIFGTK